MRLTALVLCLGLSRLLFAAPSRPALLPWPKELVVEQGAFKVPAKLAVAAKGEGAGAIQAPLARWIERYHDHSTLDAAAGAAWDGAHLRIDARAASPAVLTGREDESYELKVSEAGIAISAATDLGALRGLETLQQWATAHQKTQGKLESLPACRITDAPRFAWRGLLLDVCRHWMPVETVKRTLDAMAVAKLNVLHWHLSEDQGFRVESKAAPKLHELGSNGLYYTQAQVREVLAYARERGIRVMPEFDMPGHVTAWLVGYPELGSAPGPYAIEKKFGIFDPAFDPSREEVFAFLDAFLQEMTALFPDPYFHLGGDENNGKQWNSAPAIQTFKYKMGFSTNEDLQAYFSGRVAQILKKYGKRFVGWDEILHTELPEGTVVHSWRGTQGMVEAASRGYDTILSNGYYLDLSFPALRHYAQDPLPADSPIPLSLQAHVLGGEACMWSELVDQDNVDSRLWPRALAVAERLWSPREVKDIDDYYERSGWFATIWTEFAWQALEHRARLLKPVEAAVPSKSLGALLEVLEPVKGYARHRSRVYTTDTPLNRVVDAVDVDSLTAREFKSQVDAYLRGGLKAEDGVLILKHLQGWGGDNLHLKARVPWLKLDRALAGQLAAYGPSAEIAPLAKDLADAARLAKRAMDELGRRRSASTHGRLIQDTKALDACQAPKGELELAIVPAVRKLVLAAAQVDALKNTPAAAWEKSLEEQLPKPKGW